MGGTIIVTGKGIIDEEFWDLFENERVTSLHAVASTYEMLYKMDLFSEDFPYLRLMTQAGGKLDRNLQSYFAGYAGKYKKRFIIMYGQCEATAAISYLPAKRALDKPESVGIPITGGVIKLIDAQGNEIEEPHVQGEIVYCGRNVTLGYATCGEDLIKDDEWKGILHTGDVGERDEEGFLYITGRLKRFVKMAGHRISLDEIDGRIMNEIHVRCISAGEDDDLTVFVTSDDDKESVKNYIRQEMSILRPKTKVIKIDGFPQNESGKILYEKLFEMAKEQ
jgi:acyl-coenzyme A synthetase/AMP-(fatty) acid ligase